jgi:hypothetical protein
MGGIPQRTAGFAARPIAAKYIPQILAESRQIGLIGGVVLQVAYAARLP